MSGSYFLDTNVLVYAFDRSSPNKAGVSQGLLQKAIATGNGVISFQVIQEFMNLALKRFERPFTPIEAERHLRESFLPLFIVHSSASLYTEALSLFAVGGLSWYDSLIVAAALQAKCDLLYSEDMQHGRRFGSLRIVNPFL